MVDYEVDEDYELEDAVQIAFGVFDRGETGSCALADMLGLARFYYGEVLGATGHKLQTYLEHVESHVR